MIRTLYMLTLDFTYIVSQLKPRKYISSPAKFTDGMDGTPAAAQDWSQQAEEMGRLKKKKNFFNYSRLPIVQPGLENEVGCQF